MRLFNLKLDYEGFEEDLVVGGNAFDGIQYIFRFDNNYGASVVKFSGTYGYRSDLWELSVIGFDETGVYNVIFDTPITDDVIGHLTDGEVCWYLGRIRDLPKYVLTLESH